MAKKYLKPIIVQSSWSVQVKQLIFKLFKEILIQPLLIEYENADLKSNSKDDPIIKAMKSGNLSYQNGFFRAVKWNASIIKALKTLGAQFVEKDKSYFLASPQLPENLQKFIRLQNLKLSKLYTKMLIKIDGMSDEMTKQISLHDLKQYADTAENKTNKEFKKTVADKIAVIPTLSDEQRILIDEGYFSTIDKPIKMTLKNYYSQNIETSMKYFTNEEVTKLRKMVADQIFEGRPWSELISKINGRLHVGRSRAKFIASQETSLFVSNLKEIQYKAAGINSYRWSTLGDENVRDSHKILNKKTFSWDDPPIVDRLHGRRAHPGEDFNCRCVAIPIFEEK